MTSHRQRKTRRKAYKDRTIQKKKEINQLWKMLLFTKYMLTGADSTLVAMVESGTNAWK